MSLSKALSDTTDVIIIGSGPVSLTIACELLRRGISCYLIEQQVAPAMVPKATELHTRTLELLEQLDIAEEILAHGQPLYSMAVYSNGHHLAQFPLEIRDNYTRFQYMLMLKPYQLEQILQKRLASLKGHIEYGMHIQSITQDEYGVTLLLVDPEGQEQSVHASWLVACGNDQNIIHQQLELPFTGIPIPPWLVADVKLHCKCAEDLQNTLHIFFSPDSLLLAYPLEDYWRIIDSNPNLAQTRTEQAVVEQITRKIQAATGLTGITAHSPGGVSLFTIHAHKSSTSRSHRCFIISNAAHSDSPIGGQEMNMDIQDAFNLGWKLALVCKKASPESLLDSYIAERVAASEETLYTHDFITQLPYMQAPAIRYFRDKLLTTIMRIEPLREILLNRITSAFSELTIAYPYSKLNGQKWPYTPDGSNYLGELEPGMRLPDFQLGNLNGAHTQYLFHALKGKWYSLLLFTGQDCSVENLHTLETLATNTQARYSEYITIYFVVSSIVLQKHLQWKGTILLDVKAPVQTLHQHFGAQQSTLYLIRPDGYISYRSQPADEKKFFSYLDQLLAHPQDTYQSDEQEEAPAIEETNQAPAPPSKLQASVATNGNEKVPALVTSTSAEKQPGKNSAHPANVTTPTGIPKDAM